MLKRIYSDIEQLLQKNKVLIIYGPRRVGKTTLLKEYLKSTKKKYLLDLGDNIKTQNLINSQDFSQILDYVEGKELIVIDEAQQIANIGMGLKIIVDQVDDIFVIATGSSSFDLSQQIGEPLTGQKNHHPLSPIAKRTAF